MKIIRSFTVAELQLTHSHYFAILLSIDNEKVVILKGIFVFTACGTRYCR